MFAAEDASLAEEAEAESDEEPEPAAEIEPAFDDLVRDLTSEAESEEPEGSEEEPEVIEEEPEKSEEEPEEIEEEPALPELSAFADTVTAPRFEPEAVPEPVSDMLVLSGFDDYVPTAKTASEAAMPAPSADLPILSDFEPIETPAPAAAEPEPVAEEPAAEEAEPEADTAEPESEPESAPEIAALPEETEAPAPQEPEILEIPDLAPIEEVQIPGLHIADGTESVEEMPEIPDLNADVLEAPAEINVAAEIEIPEDGKFTVKECRKQYHGEASFTVPYGYREIRAGAFAAVDDLENLIISDTISKIGNGAFSDCENLKSVYIPNSVAEIGEDAFDGCSSLESVTIPRRFEDAVSEMFSENVKINWLEETDSQTVVTGAGKYTYKTREKEYDGSGKLTIAEGYREIRAGACAGMEDLKELVLPESLTKICSGAFADCTGLETVAIPAGVTYLDPEAFDGCTNIKLVVLPPHLEEAGREAFPNVDLFFLD